MTSQEAEDAAELRIQQLEKEREDELLQMGRPDAPEPSSLHRLSSVQGSTTSAVAAASSAPEGQQQVCVKCRDPISKW